MMASPRVPARSLLLARFRTTYKRDFSPTRSQILKKTMNHVKALKDNIMKKRLETGGVALSGRTTSEKTRKGGADLPPTHMDPVPEAPEKYSGPCPSFYDPVNTRGGSNNGREKHYLSDDGLSFYDPEALSGPNKGKEKGDMSNQGPSFYDPVDARSGPKQGQEKDRASGKLVAEKRLSKTGRASSLRSSTTSTDTANLRTTALSPGMDWETVDKDEANNLFPSSLGWTETDTVAANTNPTSTTTDDRANASSATDRVTSSSSNNNNNNINIHMPGAFYVPGVDTIDLQTAEEFSVWPFSEEDIAVHIPEASNDPSELSPVAAHLVDTDEEARRIQDLEAQNRMFRARESNVVDARVLSKGEIVKSLFNLRDPEFRRQRIGILAFIVLATTAIVLGVVLTRDNRIPKPFAADEPTPPPTPEPTSVVLGNLSDFLAEQASFDQGAALVDQSTPQYQAAKWLSNNTNIESYDDQQLIQRYALATLYFSTNGDNWTNNDGWLSDDNECRTWEHLLCANDEVNRIDLKDNGLAGAMPRELGLFSNSLQKITLRDNEMTGMVPTEVAYLTILNSLDVDYNYLEGTLMTELGLLTKLNWLGMRESAFSGTIPTEIFLLTNLLTLRLGNELSGTIPTAVGHLTNLNEITLSSNALIGEIPSEIGLLNKLTDLSLHNNQLSGTIPTDFGLLVSLNWMYLNGNSLDGTIPSEIALLRTSLTELFLWSNSLSGTILTTIGSLSRLEELQLDDNDFTGTIPSELGALTSVKQFLLGKNKLTGTIPSELALLTTLTVFFLNENSFTGQIPNGIGNLTNLIYLSLRRNELTGTIPSSIYDLTNLETLWLQNNSFTGSFTCPADIDDCKISCGSDDEACRVL